MSAVLTGTSDMVRHDTEMTDDGRPASRFLTRAECAALVRRVAQFADPTQGGRTIISLDSTWNGNLRWTRNSVISSGDVRDNDLLVRRGVGLVAINMLNDAALEAAVRRAERVWRTGGAPDFSMPAVWEDPYVWPSHAKPVIWSDATYALTAERRAETMRGLIEPAVRAGMRAAGYLETTATGRAVMDAVQTDLYYPYTEAQYTVTVRDPKGTGSGWAGLSHFDWTKIDAERITAVALDKCLRSRNPVRIEPGRYTAILEPQAVCDLCGILFGPALLDRSRAENNDGVVGPYSTGKGRAKLGERVFDARLNVTSHLMEPEMGTVPFSRSGGAYTATPITWIERGILMTLAYNRGYAIATLGRDEGGLYPTGSFRMSSVPDVETATIDDMIATTRRGVLVTRFWDVDVVDRSSVLSTGYTRDGLWLIENGKISKAIHNFRFTESPVFVLNNIEQIGVPQRVFRPQLPTVVPALKVRDFSFTSLTDAV